MKVLKMAGLPYLPCDREAAEADARNLSADYWPYYGRREWSVREVESKEIEEYLDSPLT